MWLASGIVGKPPVADERPDANGNGNPAKQVGKVLSRREYKNPYPKGNNRQEDQGALCT
jgi:hypothetical protein